MSTEEQPQVEEKAQVEAQDAQMHEASAPPTEPAAMASATRKRPRLNLTVDSRERKRGKTMFGIVLGTLNRAKNEDKERNASDAAKKRQLIEQRLQDKLRKETDSVRRAEEAKKDKTVANRKEEELQLKDSIHKLRRTRLPLLANFLSTSDQVPTDDSSEDVDITADPVSPPSRTQPPPIYYLPVTLTTAQEAFLKRRKEEAKEAAEKEWEEFKAERTAGVEEIQQLRERVAEEEERKKTERRESTADEDVPMSEDHSKESIPAPIANGKSEEKPSEPPTMEVDEERPATEEKAKEEEPKKEPASAPEPTPAAPEVPVTSQAGAADEDDAVEY